MHISDFPPGTPVRIRQTVDLHRSSVTNETVGVVESWEDQPTGSWYAHGKNDKLWLTRLKLRKADGEQTLLVINPHTTIAKLEAAK